MVDHIIRKLVKRPNYLKDHFTKYLEFEVSITERLAILREIAESLPVGKRKEQMIESINYIHASFNEILKDHNALQEGSVARNKIEDMAATIIFQEREIDNLTHLTNHLTNRLKNANA